MTEDRLYNCDCVEGARRYIGDDSIDLMICDPPYGIDGGRLDKHYNRREEFVVGGYVDVPPERYAQFSLDWIKEAERILRPGGSIYVVSGYTNLHHVLNALHSTSLVEVNHLIWKYNFGVYTSKKYISSHYHILYWRKPSKKGMEPTFNTFCRYGDSETGEDGRGSLNYLDREDVFVINREYKPGEEKNKNELPSELLIKMIQYSSDPGDVVCDMFLGGFSTARTAKGLGRDYVGFEISRDAYDMGMRKIRAMEPGSMLWRLRRPEANVNVNGGKEWTDEDRRRLEEIVSANEGRPRKEVVGTACRELGRGRCGVQREMARLGLDRRSRDVTWMNHLPCYALLQLLHLGSESVTTKHNVTGVCYAKNRRSFKYWMFAIQIRSSTVTDVTYFFNKVISK